MRKIILSFFLVLGVAAASAQTAKPIVSDSIAKKSGSVNFQSVKKSSSTVKAKKLSRKERKELMERTVVVPAVIDCYGGHDSVYTVYKDSFTTIKPLRKDTITLKQ